MARRDREFWESAGRNSMVHRQYYNRLTELSISMFEWKNLPASVDPRFLELTLFAEGRAIFFVDEELGPLALQCTIGSKMNVYRIPTHREAIAVNGYHNALNKNNSVLIFNNMLHTNSMLDVRIFAERLADLDRTIEINARAQKTPILLQCEETQRLTVKNMYKEYDGNAPVIYGDKQLSPNSIKVVTTGAPFVADKLYTLKTQIWNEALTYLGISNINVQKKERLITDEVTRNQGGVIASRYSRLEARREACKQINEMFNLDIWCDYREDYQSIDPVADDTVEGEPNTDGEGGEVNE